jgi:hypothetical protein
MTSTTPQAKKQRRMAREQAVAPALPTRAPSKLDQVEALLRRDQGTTIAEIMTATGWQQHSVRGAIAGALRKRGLAIVSEKIDGVRFYRAAAR